jgi:hypothetical protein
MVSDKEMSVRQVCKIVDLPRSVYRYKKIPKDDSALMHALEELVAKHPTIGFGKCIIGSVGKATTGTISDSTGYTSC